MPKTNEQQLYSSVAMFVRDNKGATPRSTPYSNAAIKVMDAFSKLLGVPVGKGPTNTPLYVMDRQQMEAWNLMCDAGNVTRFTSRADFVRAMQTLTDHLASDVDNAINADLITLSGSAQPEERWRKLEALLDNAGVPTVDDAVNCSTVIERIAADDAAADAFGNASTPYDRLVAVANTRLSQPPKEGTDQLISMEEFVQGLEKLETEGRTDLIENVLTGNIDPNTGNAWTLEDAVEVPPPPENDPDEQDAP